MKKIIFMLVLGALAAASQADLLVNLPVSTDMVTANQSLQGNTGNPVYIPFSMSSPRSPASGYTGPVFFGGAGGTVSLSTRLFYNTTPDYIGIGGTSTGIGSRVWSLWMFTNSAATITQVVYDARIGGTSTSVTNTVRIVVKKNGSYYISQANSAGNTYYTNSMTSWSWYNYDPISSLTDVGSQVVGFTLDNVDAIGKFHLIEVTSTSGPSLSTGTRTFQAWGTIPEPATVGMLGLGALVTLLIRRIRS